MATYSLPGKAFSAPNCNRQRRSFVRCLATKNSARLTTGPAAPTALFGSAGPSGLLRFAPVALPARLDNRNVSQGARTIVDIAAPFLALWLKKPASPGEAGLSERQLTGFQMMTFFVASSPGAGATLP